jgi:hypothetical protein
MLASFVQLRVAAVPLRAFALATPTLAGRQNRQDDLPVSADEGCRKSLPWRLKGPPEWRQNDHSQPMPEGAQMVRCSMSREGGVFRLRRAVSLRGN